MPLESGSSDDAIRANIRTEYQAIKAKHPDWSNGKIRKQAVAIAYNKSRESK